METKDAVDALFALGHESRLKVFRLLVQAGPEGVSAGRIGEELGLPPATLSFHLAHLARTGLVESRQDGRFLIYSASFQYMNSLLGFLTQNCCSGEPCAPCTPPTTSKGKNHEALPRARRRA
jgi:ArsR family transcriptional regulator